MKSILKYIACAMLCCTAPSLHAQYIMVMNDNTRIHLADNPLTFAGSGEQGTTLSVDGVDYNLQDIASIEYAGPVTTPIALAYHPYYSSRLPLAEMVTHIDYGFAEVYVRDGEYQGFKLQGSESAFRRIVQLKQEHPGVKICLSFTHTVVNSDNHQDGGFSAIAASDEYRRQFAQDCLDFLVKWGIDGVDLDWEFQVSRGAAQHATPSTT